MQNKDMKSTRKAKLRGEMSLFLNAMITTPVECRTEP